MRIGHVTVAKNLKSWLLSGPSSRKGLYECSGCGKQFTITTKTPLHSTKLPLRTWLMAMYFMVNSSKGISSVYLAKWLGVRQKTAWKVGHAIRAMMKAHGDAIGPLTASSNWMKSTLAANHALNRVSSMREAKEPAKAVFMLLSSVRAKPKPRLFPVTVILTWHHGSPQLFLRMPVS